MLKKAGAYWHVWIPLLWIPLELRYQGLPDAFRYFASVSWRRDFLGLLQGLLAVGIPAYAAHLFITSAFRGLFLRKLDESTGLVLGSGLVVLFAIHPEWQRTPALSKLSKNGSPSFVVMSLDSVNAKEFQNSVASKTWQETAIEFRNAYSSTNSTFTSLVSVLSGQLPFENGAETLFPRERARAEARLIPHLLVREGYRTVFMTDCASSAFFSGRSGFLERYQPDLGVGGSLRAMIFSRLTVMTTLHALTGIFGELESESSRTYRPADFFERVRAKEKELRRGTKPYFLFAHSCATSPETLHRTGDERELGPARSSSYREYRRGIRKIPQWISPLMNDLKESKREIWFYLLSDHGVRYRRQADGGEYLSHAVGLPAPLSQFHVPLLIFRFPAALEGRQVGELSSLARLRSLWETQIAKGHFTPEFLEVPSLALTSSLPIEPGHALYNDAIRDVHLDATGAPVFGERTESQLRNDPPVGLLSDRGLVVFQRGRGAQCFYHESSGSPQACGASEMHDALRLLCMSYPRFPCPLTRLSSRDT